MAADRETRPSWAVIGEAAAALAAGAVAGRLVPIARIPKMLGAHQGQRHSSNARDVEIVRRALDAWTRRLPLPPKCFARGLAAYWMLRRRGHAPKLYYGAATIGGKLKAHVWVRSGRIDVVGCDVADEYALLATFPESR